MIISNIILLLLIEIFKESSSSTVAAFEQALCLNRMENKNKIIHELVATKATSDLFCLRNVVKRLVFLRSS